MQKCTNFDFGSAPDPAGEAHVQHSPDHLAEFKGLLLLMGGRAGKGRVGKGEGDRGGRKGKAGGKGERGEGEGWEGNGSRGINLPHGRLKTLAALLTLVICMTNVDYA